MITVEQLSKTFVTQTTQPGWLGWTKPRHQQTVEAVKNVSFAVEAGEFPALLGPNGAGKTTILKLLAGILYPTAGYIDVFGYQPFQKSLAFKQSISFVMAQKTQLFLELPVRDTFDFIAEIYDVDPTHYRRRRDQLVERFGLGNQLTTAGRRLSLGQRMKCELICSFLYTPQIVFLDEPTIGLDVTSAQEVRRFLRETNQQEGATIILTTHNMQDVEELCSRTLLINHGETVFDGPTQSLKKTFGDNRDITFTFDPQGLKPHRADTLHQQLEDFEAQVLEHTPQQLRVRCARSNTTPIINLVLLQTSVAEIDFSDEDLTSVIAKLYTAPQQSSAPTSQP